ncbi:MAG: hypothetical protein DI630_00630 [Gordonia sp. (in: high G+C Gram-positive bacteria)]|nr:MAG: hypothetical protein DI630_00630 [Gordonia sp. (in: high G+C Gram-positive bacteria)]
MGPVGHTVVTRMVSQRAHLAMTQGDLSEAVTRRGRRLGRQAIAEIETHRRRVDVDDLTALAEALETTTAYLMGEIDDPDQRYS